MRLTHAIRLRSHSSAHSVTVPRGWVTAISVIWVAVCLYIAQSFLPHNVISLPGQGGIRKVATVAAPQGWAFFTKSGKDPQYAPYRMTGGRWHSAALGPHSKPSNFFGFDRKSRSQGVEIALLLHQKNVRWTSCEGAQSVRSCLAHAKAPTTATTNPSPAPTLCGLAAAVEVQPVPWAWRHLSSERHTPERVAVWSVTCP
ncbi:SdpA family antimicrobial peptide system protein [Streptomyces sp. AV19]|uniref:SdpA family antimicrobial peptide system protein n=1 Tax=Streptomyces sp. AV19 TaxID=2793068 RepID=UPI0018FE4B69|nr:SdpA family antimicrobial peptide system protein [Streptomyces sp. AV19]MBH1938632.1 SdpA family antimicrobial peptide system protein [Streptomyces sp. AV19]MDG4535344.1 SdpA family antimicrobial peptide system protein [Streptomyces sp. AV19]